MNTEIWLKNLKEGDQLVCIGIDGILRTNIV
jgi:hypothetical protein